MGAQVLVYWIIRLLLFLNLPTPHYLFSAFRWPVRRRIFVYIHCHTHSENPDVRGNVPRRDTVLRIERLYVVRRALPHGRYSPLHTMWQ